MNQNQDNLKQQLIQSENSQKEFYSTALQTPESSQISQIEQNKRYQKQRQQHFNSQQILSIKEEEQNSNNLYQYYEQNSKNIYEKTIIDQDILDKTSLAKHPYVKQSLKMVLPCLFLLNSVMFLYCNIANGANLQTSASIFSLETQKATIGEFTLYGSVSDMWKAGVYPLAIIILTFSGIWPYIKITGMIFCWYLSQKSLSFQKRETLLIILDVMGKWSLIDSYFMIIMIVAFRFMIDLNILGIQFSMNVTVTPTFDFYCYVMATMLSLILTHIVIHNHRKSVETLQFQQNELQKKQKRNISVQNNKNLLVKELKNENNNNNLTNSNINNNNNYTIQHIQRNDSATRMLEHLEERVCLGGDEKRAYKWFTPTLIIAGAIIMIFGYFVKVFTFTFQGLAGWALKQDASTSYSLWELGYYLPLKTYTPDSFSIRILQLLYFTFTIVIPFTYLGLMFALNTMKLKLKDLKKIFAFAEILYAWSSIDVLTVAMISSLFEIGQFAKFMIGNKCDGINNGLKKLTDIFPNAFHLDGHDTCFALNTSLEIGSALLITSSVVFFLLGTHTLRSLQKNLDSRLENIGDRRLSSVQQSFIFNQQYQVQQEA